MISGIQFRSRAGVEEINSGPSLTTRIFHPLLKEYSAIPKTGAESHQLRHRADDLSGGKRAKFLASKRSPF
jgi:hypothetical protein